jgi:hypothetical protein
MFVYSYSYIYAYIFMHTGSTLAAAVNPALCVLLLSLRKAGLQEEACATLQSIADMDNTTPVWAPDPDLLSQVRI